MHLLVKELVRYIHLNPLRAGMVKSLQGLKSYPYSGHVCGINKPHWLRTEFIHAYFGLEKAEAERQYRKFVESMLGREYESPLKKAVGASILGAAAFVEKIQKEYIRGHAASRDLPDVGRLAGRPTVEEIEQEAEKLFGSNGDGPARKAALFFSHKYSGKSLRELAERFSLSQSGISQASRRFEQEMTADTRLKDLTESMKQGLGL